MESAGELLRQDLKALASLKDPHLLKKAFLSTS